MLYTKEDLAKAFILGHMSYLPDTINEIQKDLDSPILKKIINRVIGLIENAKEKNNIVDKSNGKLELLRNFAKNNNTIDQFENKLKDLERHTNYRKQIIIYSDISKYCVYFEIVIREEYCVPEEEKVVLVGGLVFNPNLNTWGIHT